MKSKAERQESKETISKAVETATDKDLGDILSWLYQLEYAVRKEIKRRKDQGISFADYFPDKK